jgi:hypothetical protein
VAAESPQDWVTLATAPHQLVAELWQQVLADEGIATRLQPADAVSFLGVSSLPCRVMVRRGDYATAQAVLSELTEEPQPEDA